MNFGRKARRVARRQYRRGKITFEEYRKVREASRDPVMVAKWEAEVERQLGAPWKAKGAIDWASIWEWFLENWPTILKILLTLLVFIEPNPMEEESPES
jgi:methionine synthase II (cobalamin-independent)